MKTKVVVVSSVFLGFGLLLGASTQFQIPQNAKPSAPKQNTASKSKQITKLNAAATQNSARDMEQEVR